MTRQIDIIRHGDHTRPYIVPGLSEQGVAEAVEVGRQIGAKDAVGWLAVVGSAPRYIHTATIALFPGVSATVVPLLSDLQTRRGNLIASDDFIYRPMVQPDFKRAMLSAYEFGRAMEFLMSQSDSYLRDHELSTYSTMAAVIARSIITHQDRDTLFCAKELFRPCFRARVTQERHGVGSAADYAEWYMDKQEQNPIGRTSVMRIEQEEDDYLLSDACGEVEFGAATLEEIAGAT